MASQAPISDAAVEAQADDNPQPGLPTDADGNQYIEVDGPDDLDADSAYGSSM
ncbi:hypothetical protein LTS17_011333 [Exophiala oligosperma]